MPLTASVAEAGNPSPGASGWIVSAASAAEGTDARHTSPAAKASLALVTCARCIGTSSLMAEPASRQQSGPLRHAVGTAQRARQSHAERKLLRAHFHLKPVLGRDLRQCA